MVSPISFTPTPEDDRILRDTARPGESREDTLRRALSLLDRERWLARFYADAEKIKDEHLAAEPDAW